MIPGLGFYFYRSFGLLASIFWFWMIYDCIRNDPDRHIWIWVLLFLNFPGAVIYFIVRRLPQTKIPIPKLFLRWTRRRELWQAEADVKNIGDAYQYVVLGDLLCELGQKDRAGEAYKEALKKNGSEPRALWGAALIEVDNDRFENAKEYLQKLLASDPAYSYGEASLLYGRALASLNDLNSAKVHIEKHLENWNHPEAHIILATILINEGNNQEAINHLETVLADIKGAPVFYYRKNQSWLRKAKKILKTVKHNK